MDCTDCLELAHIDDNSIPGFCAQILTEVVGEIFFGAEIDGPTQDILFLKEDCPVITPHFVI